MACPISFSSSTSLNLKTPFVDAQTERRGLQRRVSNRRKITEEEFGAAVKKRQTGGKCDDKNTLRPNVYTNFVCLPFSEMGRLFIK